MVRFTVDTLKNRGAEFEREVLMAGKIEAGIVTLTDEQWAIIRAREHPAPSSSDIEDAIFRPIAGTVQRPCHECG